jgi:hypothetical protein
MVAIGEEFYNAAYDPNTIQHDFIDKRLHTVVFPADRTTDTRLTLDYYISLHFAPTAGIPILQNLSATGQTHDLYITVTPTKVVVDEFNNQYDLMNNVSPIIPAQMQFLDAGVISMMIN